MNTPTAILHTACIDNPLMSKPYARQVTIVKHNQGNRIASDRVASDRVASDHVAARAHTDGQVQRCRRKSG
jgi:hypothetical protein